MKPGLYPYLSNDDYHKPIGLSNSGVRKILDCPARYYHEYLSGQPREQTDAMLLGSILHTMILEPDSFNDRYAVLPKIDKRTKEGKATFAALQSYSVGKILVEEKMYHSAKLMADAVKRSKYNALVTDGFTEHSVFWEMDGVTLKARPDFYDPKRKIIIDLKKTQSANPINFVHSIWKYGYHSQAAMIMDGLHAATEHTFDNYIILAIEEDAPHIIQPFNLLPETIAKGRQEYYRGVEIYKECKEWGIWPAYSDEIIDISLPEYYLTRN